MVSHPIVVACGHRRAAAFCGETNRAYASIVLNAETCGAYLQLDSLDHTDREAYLNVSLGVTQVPIEVSKWVSDTSNGIPEYIELCAKLIDRSGILLRQAVEAPKVLLASSAADATLGSRRRRRVSLATGAHNGHDVSHGGRDRKGSLPFSVINPDGGVEALAKLQVPPLITGFVRSTLGSLGPQERLLVQTLSLLTDGAGGVADVSRPTAELVRFVFNMNSHPSRHHIFTPTCFLMQGHVMSAWRKSPQRRWMKSWAVWFEVDSLNSAKMGWETHFSMSSGRC